MFIQNSFNSELVKITLVQLVLRLLTWVLCSTRMKVRTALAVPNIEAIFMFFGDGLDFVAK